MPTGDCLFESLLLDFDIALQEAGTYAFPVFLKRRFEVCSRRFGPRPDHFGGGHFAVVLGDVLVRRHVRQFGGDDDRLRPILLELEDFQQIPLRLLGHRRLAQLFEDLLRAIEQAGFQIVLTKFRQGLQLQILRQVLALDKALMHANGALGLTATTE